MHAEVEKKVANIFSSMPIHERYLWLEKIGIPDYVLQSVNLESDAQNAAAELCTTIEIDAPDYLPRFLLFLLGM